MARQSPPCTPPGPEPASVTQPEDVVLVHEVFTPHPKPKQRTETARVSRSNSLKNVNVLLNSLQNGLEKWKTINEKINEAINEGYNEAGTVGNEEEELCMRLVTKKESCKLELLKERLGRPAFIKRNPKKHISSKNVKLKKDFDSDS